MTHLGVKADFMISLVGANLENKSAGDKSYCTTVLRSLKISFAIGHPVRPARSVCGI